MMIFAVMENGKMNDLISRQAAIDAVLSVIPYDDYWKEQIEKVVNKLPSAQPERKGRWIKLDMHAHLANHKCTACGQECYVPTCMGEPMYTYCPHCGAKMNEETV